MAISGAGRTPVHILGIALPLLCLIVIGSHILLGYWSFPQGDIFWYGRLVNEEGIGNALADIRQTWSGRFSTYSLSCLLAVLAFPYATNLFIVASLFIFIISLTLALWRIDALSFKAALFDTAFFLLSLPKIVKREAFYWLDANIPYVVPLSLSGLVIAFIDRSVAAKCERWVLGSLLLLFIIIAGFNEPFSFLLLVVGGVCAFATQERRSFIFRRLLAMLAGTATGLWADMLAPGNYHRIYLHKRYIPSAASSIAEALGDMHFSGLLFFLLAMLAYGILRNYLYRPPAIRIRKTLAIGFLPVVFATSCGSLFLLAYEYKGFLIGGRLLLAPCLLIFIGALLVSRRMVFQPSILHKITVSIALVLVMMLPNQSIYDLFSTLQQAPHQRRTALQQIEAARQAQQKGDRAFTVEAMPYPDSLLCSRTLTSDPAFFTNEMMAHYFGLKEIRAIDATRAGAHPYTP
ncbi:MAG: hypothetical protein KGJ06_08530 [Pseudomonadota bacterium]|nr:hypothetical protein [Pseudomonadota bacterium]